MTCLLTCKVFCQPFIFKLHLLDFLSSPFHNLSYSLLKSTSILYRSLILQVPGSRCISYFEDMHFILNYDLDKWRIAYIYLVLLIIVKILFTISGGDDWLFSLVFCRKKKYCHDKGIEECSHCTLKWMKIFLLGHCKLSSAHWFKTESKLLENIETNTAWHLCNIDMCAFLKLPQNTDNTGWQHP